MIGSYFCRPGTELLELDCLIMDKTMKHIFKDYITKDEILLENPKGKLLKCNIDTKENTLQGRGLGKFIQVFKKDQFFIRRKRDNTFLICGEYQCNPKFHPGAISVSGIHFVEGDIKRDMEWNFNAADNEAFFLHQRALNFSISPGFDSLLSMGMVRNIEPYDYQIRTVKHVLQHMKGRALLADEVGLGKTIEAGLIMMEYIMRNLVKKVLILTPSSLMEQWQEEMQSKFNLDFITDDNPKFTEHNNGWLHFDRIISSIDKAKREANRSLVCEAEYDLVIVDEAHRCKNHKTLGWQMVNMLKKRYILLLTATPVENSMEELFNLITLLSPGQLDTAQNFRRRFIARGDKLKPRNVDSLKSLLKDVMIRNRRSDTNSITVRRYAQTVEILPSPAEISLYEDITNLIKSNFYHNENPALNQLSLKMLQRQIGSSTWAVGPTLLKIASNDKNSPEFAKDLEDMAERAKSIYDNSKAQALLKLLSSIDEKVLVFTGFQTTREYLVDFLQNAGLKVATLHGSMPRLKKEKAVEDFMDFAQVLVSTESGGEGRNLQFCNVIVNYDLPWNPMRIEQRIGRIHRIGQKRDVFIYNLSATGTIESKILELLDAKINMFQLVVGELDMILGNLKGERDFEDIVMDIWMGSNDPDELSLKLEDFGEQLAAARRHYEQIKQLDDNLLGELLPNEK